jgi:hypothetical protein
MNELGQCRQALLNHLKGRIRILVATQIGDGPGHIPKIKTGIIERVEGQIFSFRFSSTFVQFQEFMRKIKNYNFCLPI